MTTLITQKHRALVSAASRADIRLASGPTGYHCYMEDASKVHAAVPSLRLVNHGNGVFESAQELCIPYTDTQQVLTILRQRHSVALLERVDGDQRKPSHWVTVVYLSCLRPVQSGLALVDKNVIQAGSATVTFEAPSKQSSDDWM